MDAGSALLCAMISQPPSLAQEPELIRVLGSHVRLHCFTFRKQWSMRCSLQSPARTSSLKDKTRHGERGPCWCPTFFCRPASAPNLTPDSPCVFGSATLGPLGRKTYHPLSTRRISLVLTLQSVRSSPLLSAPSCVIPILSLMQTECSLDSWNCMKEGRVAEALAWVSSRPLMSITTHFTSMGRQATDRTTSLRA